MLSILLATLTATFSARAQELVYQDAEGVIRWTKNKQEVALFGANYCLPSACDYRAAGYVGGDRKQMIGEDLDHFRRMGWDALRLCFWGDWENSDRDGNLVANDHLDLLDYLIAEANERHIYMLLSPIVTYSSQWPDAQADTTNTGFAKHYPKHTLQTDPKAIAAQENYLRQLLAHRNPYTGRQLKDEPNILFIELINEPTQHPDNLPAMVSYIDRMVGAVRGAGCQKLTFYNVSQDFRVASAIRQSAVQGSTYAWYPTALNAGRRYEGNGLLLVDRYEQMLDPLLAGKSKIVYEFDSPDMDSGYMLPAMTREFRRGGIQFAAMFSYDMLRTAPYNLGWQTHFLNMVYTPSKAVSGMIAAEVMRRVPRGRHYGYYPENNRFGEFRVSYDEELSELDADTLFYYSNDTRTAPRSPAKLRHIAGVGSSPVVSYEGMGIYFLDKLADGSWQVEIYPDIVEVDDPFKMPNLHKPVCRSEYNERRMEIRVPGLNVARTFLPGIYRFKDNRLVSEEKLPQEEFYAAGPPKDTLSLLSGLDDWWKIRHTRTFRSPEVSFRPVPIGLIPAVKLSVKDLSPKPEYQFPCDATFSQYIGEKTRSITNLKALKLRAHGVDGTDKAVCLVVDSQGRAYGAVVDLSPRMGDILIPVSSLRPMKAAMLPQDWPGVNPYWYPLSSEETAAAGDGINWKDIQYVQVSLRDELYPIDQLKDKGVVVERIDLLR
jgi:hypothetical protein